MWTEHTLSKAVKVVPIYEKSKLIGHEVSFIREVQNDACRVEESANRDGDS